MDLLTLYSCSRVSKIFCELVKERFRKEYNTVLLNNEGIAISCGNYYPEYCVMYTDLIYTDFKPLYIMNDTIHPYNIKSQNFLYKRHPFLTTIRSYEEFLQTINTMQKNSYRESNLFIQRDSLHKSVVEFIEREAVSNLSRLLHIEGVKGRKGYYDWRPPILPVGQLVDWDEFASLIEEAINITKRSFPKISYDALYGRLYISFQ